jgi:CheY-like chemotaxis protein
MKKILVVDDDVVMIKLFQVQMKRAGLQGYFFQEGQAALEESLKLVPDLAVLDYNMPGMNGVEIIEKLRAELNQPYLPVIFVTGEVSAEVLSQINQIQHAKLLAKPFSPRKVITLIEECFCAG